MNLFLLLLIAIPSWATITRVAGQECTSTSNSGSSLTCVFTSNLTAGNAVVMMISHTVATRTLTSVTGTNCTATTINGPGSSAARFAWQVILTGCTSTTITVNLSGAMTRLDLVGEEVHSDNGNFATNPNDAGTCTTLSDCTNNGTCTGAGCIATAAFTPTSGQSEFIFAHCVNGNNSSGTAAGWTDVTTPNASGAFAYRIEPSVSGAYSRTWTISASNTWETSIGGIKEPAAAGNTKIAHHVGGN